MSSKKELKSLISAESPDKAQIQKTRKEMSLQKKEFLDQRKKAINGEDLKFKQFLEEQSHLFEALNPKTIFNEYDKISGSLKRKNRLLKNSRIFGSELNEYFALKSMIKAKDKESILQYLNILECEKTALSIATDARGGP
jgi:hypothetical protein